LTSLLSLEDKGYLKVYFADESGFSLDPTVPYGWQPCGKNVAIVPQKSKRRNVFGLMTRANEFEGYDTIGTIDSDMIIAFIDDFSCQIKQKTVLVLDNATIHHSKSFLEKIEEWKEKDLLIWFLPAYSPHLNKIETLWRKIKYEWLKPKDYLNWESFNIALDKIFNNIGTSFKVNFS
jgi:DDE superfamily endonuclease